MVKLKSILILLLCTLNSASCVTSGSGSEATAIAGTLVIFSHLVSLAQNGDASAKKAWCEAFALVDSELATNPSTDGAQDLAMTEKLIPDMHNIMRAHGYQLHRQQIGMVIKDGINVSRNEAAKKETVESCASIQST